MDKRKSFEQSLAVATALRKHASSTKEAMSLIDPITEVPIPGGHFASHKLEQDYQMKHPLVSMLHPGIYAGGGLGALAGKLLKKKPLVGAAIGGISGLALEAADRYRYLSDAGDKLEHGENPTDQRYDF
jgi:hypothetical protein